MKPLPPRPSLKSGDDTASGVTQPIIDEIASALREWHTLMFQYLARRDYKLFHTVRDHIEALHLGRRQLLAQTLSTEETVNLRRAMCSSSGQRQHSTRFGRKLCVIPPGVHLSL